jgi:hypothetical protein
MSYDNIYEKIKKMNSKEITNYILTYHHVQDDNDTVNIETLLFIAYDIHKYVLPADIKNEIVNRKYQRTFRNELIKKYESCIITKKPNIICEAVHIIPYSVNLDKRYDIYNGLLLCSELHIMFDKYLFSINSNNQIIFSNDILDDERFNIYCKYHKKKLNLDKKVLINLQEHYNTFLQKNRN